MAKFPKHEHPWHEFLALYDKADDRTCAILFGARLDDSSGNALLRVVKRPKDFEERLLRETGPLGTFSAKIDMLFCLGELDDETYHDLHVVRKIRNDFAHRLDVVGFDSNPVRSKVSTLLLPDKRSDERLRSNLSADARLKFIVGAALCDGALTHIEQKDKANA